MNFKKYHVSKNLFDYQTMEGTIKGYYLDSSGELQESELSAITDYIRCSGGVFCLSKVGGVSPSVCLYDSNKQFLYGQAYSTPSGTTKQVIYINSSVNASYIRFSYFYTGGGGLADDLSTIMLNAGANPQPYEPYGYIWSNSHYIRLNGVWQPVASAHERSGGQWY